MMQTQYSLPRGGQGVPASPMGRTTEEVASARMHTKAGIGALAVSTTLRCFASALRTSNQRLAKANRQANR
eukprot:3231863-Amphidinium_carterae.1